MRLTLALIFAALAGCTQPPTAEPVAARPPVEATEEATDRPEPSVPERASATDPSTFGTKWPPDWNPYVGRTVTVDGWADNLKEGALLAPDRDLQVERELWLNDRSSWPDGIYSKHGPSRVRVTGMLIKRPDRPVVLIEPPKPGGLQLTPAGIPVYSKEELERRKWRFKLKNATWTVLERPTGSD